MHAFLSLIAMTSSNIALLYLASSSDAKRVPLRAITYILLGIFLKRSRSFEKRLLLPSCLSVRTEQLGSRWTDFHEIFLKSVDKIKFWLKKDKNNGNFT
jgi:hypothetical protein